LKLPITKEARKKVVLCEAPWQLTGWQLLALMSAKFLRSFFGDWYLQRFLSVVSV
jgi:hypothetical protein